VATATRWPLVLFVLYVPCSSFWSLWSFWSLPPLARHHGNHCVKEWSNPPPIEHFGLSPTRPIVYVPPPGHTGMLFDHLSGKYGLRSSQVGVSFVVLFSLPAHSILINSRFIKLSWQSGILAVFFDEAEINNAIKTAITKQAAKIKIFVVLAIARMMPNDREASHAGLVASTAKADGRRGRRRLR